MQKGEFLIDIHGKIVSGHKMKTLVFVIDVFVYLSRFFFKSATIGIVEKTRT